MPTLAQTVTGWLVALLGFKVNLQYVVLPLILAGALSRVFGGKRVSAIGYALAGFGLVFVGIGMLQTGMAGFRGTVTPDVFPPDTWLGRFLLVLLGVLITIVTQSSSAGVATAITALHVGNITLPQAAAMVIGMDVGTTVTAAIAAIGGSTDAKRTGLAHVFYNILTGVGAYLLLPAYILAWTSFVPLSQQSDPEVALVAFHSLFNLLGVFLVLPFTARFAALVMRLVPDPESRLGRRLDTGLLNEPGIAVENVYAMLNDLSVQLFHNLAGLLSSDENQPSNEPILRDAELAIADAHSYLAQVETGDIQGGRAHQVLAAYHILDHLGRLVSRMGNKKPLATVRNDPELAEIRSGLAVALGRVDCTRSGLRETHDQLKRLWLAIDERLEPHRRSLIARSARGQAGIEETLDQLDAARWLRRVCYHTWRMTHHMVAEPSEQHVDDSEPVANVSLN